MARHTAKRDVIETRADLAFFEERLLAMLAELPRAERLQAVFDLCGKLCETTGDEL